MTKIVNMTNFYKYENKLDFEMKINDWNEAGLLKESIFKSSIATIEKQAIIKVLGKLSDSDIKNLDSMIKILC